MTGYGHRSTDDGKAVIHISTWALPLILAFVSGICGFVVQTLRASDLSTANVQIVNDKLKEIERAQQGQRPAAEMVSRDEFTAVIQRLDEKTDRIDRNVTELLKRRR